MRRRVRTQPHRGHRTSRRHDTRTALEACRVRTALNQRFPTGLPHWCDVTQSQVRREIVESILCDSSDKNVPAFQSLASVCRVNNIELRSVPLPK